MLLFFNMTPLKAFLNNWSKNTNIHVHAYILMPLLVTE